MKRHAGQWQNHSALLQDDVTARLIVFPKGDAFSFVCMRRLNLMLLLPHHFSLMSSSPPLPVDCYVNFLKFGGMVAVT